MKALTISLLVTLTTCAVHAQNVEDNFDSHPAGSAPERTDWSAKWDKNAPDGDPTQRDLWIIEAGAGKDGSQALVLDVDSAKRGFHSIKTKGVNAPKGADNSIRIQSNIQFSTIAEPMTEKNIAMVGLRISPNPEWWKEDAKCQNFCLVRRADSAVGISDPSLAGAPKFSIDAWILNSAVGGTDTPNGTPLEWTSAWLTLVVELVDNGTTYQATGKLYNDKELLYQSAKAWDTGIASGDAVYAGVTNGFNEAPEGTTTAKASAISKIAVDDFSLTVNPK